MKILSSIFFILIFPVVVRCQDVSPENKTQFGISVSANYSFSGISVIPAFEVICKKNILYLGPKFLTSMNYLPSKGPWGVNLGYRHEFRNDTPKRLSFFFLTDYQLISAKSFARTKEPNKRNYYHELFLGYGMQLRFFNHFYIGNAMGIGAHLEVLNNEDLDLKETFLGYNNLFRLFVHYRF